MMIEIDFEVFKAITARRPSQHVTENDVLRSLLGLPAKSKLEVAVSALGEGVAAMAGSRPGDVWVCKSVRFPVNSHLRAKYQGRTVQAEIKVDGIHVAGKVANSPSQAAHFVTNTNVNGWTFWEARFPGQQGWTPIQALRPS